MQEAEIRLRALRAVRSLFGEGDRDRLCPSAALFLTPFVVAGRGIVLVHDAKAQATALRADLETRDFIAAKDRLDGLERTALAAKSTIAFFAAPRRAGRWPADP